LSDDERSLDEAEYEDDSRRVAFMPGLTADELKGLVEQAMVIWIATAYANPGGVKNLAATLRRRGGSAKVNILLSSEFAPEQYLREAVIRELCDIPNCEVRVAGSKTPFLHSKVFVFVEGNIAHVIVGSMNLTEAAFDHNIEAGLKVTETGDSAGIRDEAIRFIEERWLESRRVEPDPLFAMPEGQHRFRINDIVVCKPTGIEGVIINCRLDNGKWVYTVYSGRAGGDGLFKEEDLELKAIHILAWPGTIAAHLVSSRTPPVEFAQYLVHRKLLDASTGNLFSYQSSRTHHYSYQFRPLLKLLSSGKKGILIADEVGLGKTIEAAIILKELSTRSGGFKRCILLCPPSLCKKWSRELEKRFDEYFDFGGYDELFQLRREYYRDPSVSAKLIIPFSQIQRGAQEAEFNMFDVPLDIVIVDEAHWMRNPDTHLYRNALKLFLQSKWVVLLTATPINTGIMNILPLLKVINPVQFSGLSSVEFRTLMSPMRTYMECYRLLMRAENDKYPEALEEINQRISKEILSHRRYAAYFENNLSFQALVRILQKLKKAEYSDGAREVPTICHLLLELNPIDSIVCRTRKADVPEIKGIVRDPITLMVKPSQHETRVYDTVRKTVAKSKRAEFGTMQPERVASSCLPIAENRYLGSGFNPATEFTISDVYSLDRDELDDTTFGDIPPNAVGIQDSKYEELRAFLKKYIEHDHGSRAKLLLFSSFLGTVEYLRIRLSHDFYEGFAESITGMNSDSERQEVQERFRNEANPAILLCTEVASEGLDFEFCKALVNYDLPWNPMKLEQRIGRIDRIGQESNRITIINLIVQGTIDEAIYERVCKRIVEIGSTIGPLSEVLGRLEYQLVPRLLSDEISREEKERLVRSYATALEKAKRLEGEFETGRGSLVGLDPFFTDEISMAQKNRRYFSPEECRFIVHNLIERSNADYGEHSVLTKPVDGVGQLTLGNMLRLLLKKRIASSPHVDVRKRERLMEALDSKKPIRVTFLQDTATRRLDAEFLTIHHPFLVTELEHLETSARARSTKMTLESTENIPEGNYLFLVFPIVVENSVSSSEARTVYFNMKLYSFETGEDLGEKAASEVYDRLLDGRYGMDSSDLHQKQDAIEALLRKGLGDLESFLSTIPVEPMKAIRGEAIAAYLRVSSSGKQR